MRRYRLVIGAVALVVGVLLLLLAHDVRSWRNTLHDDALQYSIARTDTTKVRLTAPTVLPSGLARGLLGVGRDRQWLQAVQKFTVANRTTQNLEALGPFSYNLLNGAEATLRRVTQDPDPARASQAYNLLSVLVFREAYPGSDVDPGLVQEALNDLQNAVRLDPGDEPAKENLELALRTLVAVHGAAEQKNGAGTRKTGKRLGGEAEPPGVGY